jgi:hypothetical protein
MIQQFQNLTREKKIAIGALVCLLVLGLVYKFYPRKNGGTTPPPKTDPKPDPDDEDDETKPDPDDSDEIVEPTPDPETPVEIVEPTPDPDAMPGEEGYVYPACQWHAMGKSKGVNRDKCHTDRNCQWHGNVDTGKCQTRVLMAPVVCGSLGKPRYCYANSSRCNWDASLNKCMARPL